MSRRRTAVLAVAVLLVACNAPASSTDDDTQPPATTARGAVDQSDLVEVELPQSTYQPCRSPTTSDTIVVWEAVEPLFADDLRGLFDEFTDSTGIDVELVHFTGENEILQELAAISSDDWPHAVLAHETAGRAMVDSERVVPPGNCDPEVTERFLPVATIANQVDGQLAAVPLWMSVPLLYVDANKLRAAGIDFSLAPSSLSDLMDWSSALVASGVSTHGLALTEACGALVADHLMPTIGGVLTPDNGRSERGRRIAITEEQIQQLAAYLDLLRSAVNGHAIYISPDPTGFSDLLAISDPESDAAMAVHSSAALQPVLDAVDTLYQGIEVALLPIPGGGTVGTTSLWLLSSNDPTVATLAWPLADWLTTDANLAGWSAATSLPSPTLGMSESPVLQEAWANEPRLRVPHDAIAAVPGAVSSTSVVVGPWLQIMAARSRLCASVVNGQSEANAAVRVFLDDVNNAIDAYEMARIESSSSSSINLRLTISCENGAEVAGVWIQAATSASGFAARSDDGTYDYTLESGGSFAAHVGCGDDDGQWVSTEWSPILFGSQGELSCSGRPSVVPGACSLG